MSGLANPQERFAFTDIDHAIASPTALTPMLVSNHLARELDGLVGLERILDADGECDGLRGCLLGEVMLHVLIVVKCHADRRDLLFANLGAPALAYRPPMAVSQPDRS